MPILYQAPLAEPKPLKKPRSSKLDGIFPQGGKLSALVVRPARTHFQAQERDEEIVLLLRRHWVTNFGWLAIAGFFLIVPISFGYIPLISFLPNRFQFMVVIIWYLLTIAFIFEKFLAWYFNVYIVTNKRVVDLDFYNIIYYNQAQADLENITDMNMTVSGISRLFFDYGDLVIETAGQYPNLEFGCVPNPRKVIQIIEKLKR